MSDIFTATGAKISIGPVVSTLPANGAAWAALTPYVEIGFVESLGEFGDESASVDFAVLGDGRIRKAKGARNSGELALACAYIADDAGQIAMETAEGTNLSYAFKVELPNKITGGGTNEFVYFKGLVMSKRRNVGSNDNVVRRTFNIGLNSALTVIAAT
jgi:hypothetical protein